MLYMNRLQARNAERKDPHKKRGYRHLEYWFSLNYPLNLRGPALNLHLYIFVTKSQVLPEGLIGAPVGCAPIVFQVLNHAMLLHKK